MTLPCPHSAYNHLLPRLFSLVDYGGGWARRVARDLHLATCNHCHHLPSPACFSCLPALPVADAAALYSPLPLARRSPPVYTRHHTGARDCSSVDLDVPVTWVRLPSAACRHPSCPVNASRAAYRHTHLFCPAHTLSLMARCAPGFTTAPPPDHLPRLPVALKASDLSIAAATWRPARRFLAAAERRRWYRRCGVASLPLTTMAAAFVATSRSLPYSTPITRQYNLSLARRGQW